MGGYPLLKDPKYKPGMGVTSIHEPQKYMARGMLFKLPGKSIDNDGFWDLEELYRRFPGVKIEELTFVKDDGSVHKLIDGK